MDEAHKKAVLARRAEKQGLADRIEQGTAYSEKVTVFFTDHAPHEVEVFAISAKQFRAACRRAGIVPDPAAVKDPAKMLSSLDLLGELAVEGTSAETCDQLLNIDEEAKVALKVMELIKVPKSSTPSLTTESTLAPSRP
jgi:hypothetical protein